DRGERGDPRARPPRASGDRGSGDVGVGPRVRPAGVVRLVGEEPGGVRGPSAWGPDGADGRRPGRVRERPGRRAAMPAAAAVAEGWGDGDGRGPAAGSVRRAVPV